MRGFRWARAAALALALLTAVPAAAQEAASLVADRVRVTGENRLTAEGNVEVFYQGSRLNAARVIYDAGTDMLTIEGPIRLREEGAEGNVVVADSAALSGDLREGVLRGARLVLARELQLAAREVTREGGRITTFSNVVASSCQICAANPTPLWEIRARRITHDEETRRLTFEGAQFRVAGVPLAFVPALRTPDPTVERMDGVLRPSVRSTSGLGFGVKIPYFVTLGESRDLTFTPYIAAAHTATLELRYRQAFSLGQSETRGALSRDSLRPGETRGYVFSDTVLALPREYRLGIALRLASDRSYLVDYGISDADRLWSGLTLDRVRADRMLAMRIGNTHTLRAGESNSTQPVLAGDFTSIRLYRAPGIGGQAALEWGVHAHRRSSDLARIGRDMARLTVAGEWERSWLLPGGVLGTAEAGLAADHYIISQDPDYPNHVTRAQPVLAAELRWPWLRTTARGAEVIEPVAQVVWSRSNLTPVPNEDSRLLEFDEGNLYALSRYPGQDAREGGLRATLGLGWRREDAAGWSLGATVGRILRARASDGDGFGPGSGLSGSVSDWLLSTQLSTENGLLLSNRALIGDDFSLTRDELRLGWTHARFRIAAGYVWMQSDPGEGRDTATSELLLDTGWQITPNWRSSFETRYDFTADSTARAGIGMQYINECIIVDLSLSRRFTSSTSLRPETSIGFSAELVGFGSGTPGPSRACAR